MEKNEGKAKIVKLHCDDQYLNYTIGNFTSCCDFLSDESIERFTEFFDKLSDCELRKKNEFVDGTVNSGYELHKCDDRQRVNEFASRSLMDSISSVASEETPKTKREILVLKASLSLAHSMAYLKIGEVFSLNNIFDNVQLFKHDLFGPYNDEFYYTKRKAGR